MPPFNFHEFLTIAFVHFVVVITPGADFAMIVKQSIVFGRKTSVFTSIGIGLGMLLHCTYTLVGFGLVISQSILFYNTIKYLGAGYLCYLGIRAVLSKKKPPQDAPGTARSENGELNEPRIESQSAAKAVLTGFLVNALNPKATLFFLSIFSAIVSASTPIIYQIGYSVWIFIVQIAWFSFVSVVFSQGAVQTFFGRFGHWIERIMGSVFLALSVRLALSSNK